MGSSPLKPITGLGFQEPTYDSFFVNQVGTQRFPTTNTFPTTNRFRSNSLPTLTDTNRDTMDFLNAPMQSQGLLNMISLDLNQPQRDGIKSPNHGIQNPRTPSPPPFQAIKIDQNFQSMPSFTSQYFSNNLMDYTMEKIDESNENPLGRIE